MVQSGVALGMFSFSMWGEAKALLPLPSISFICSWRLEGTGFLPDRRPSAWLRETDDESETDVPETEERADVSGLPANREGRESDKGDEGAVPFFAPVWTGCAMAAACWDDNVFCAGGGDDASPGAAAGWVELLNETDVVVGWGDALVVAGMCCGETGVAIGWDDALLAAGMCCGALLGSTVGDDALLGAPVFGNAGAGASVGWNCIKGDPPINWLGGCGALTTAGATVDGKEKDGLLLPVETTEVKSVEAEDGRENCWNSKAGVSKERLGELNVGLKCWLNPKSDEVEERDCSFWRPNAVVSKARSRGNCGLMSRSHQLISFDPMPIVGSTVTFNSFRDILLSRCGLEWSSGKWYAHPARETKLKFYI